MTLEGLTSSPPPRSTETEPRSTGPRGTLSERFARIVARAREGGMQVAGVDAAEAALTPDVVDRLEGWALDDEGLAFLADRASRIEFIVEGGSRDLLAEPEFRTHALFRQIIDYDLCKACRLCIQVCPKHVYKDDGLGHPDPTQRREHECTGPHQCGQCSDVCPENIVRVVPTEPAFESTVFLRLPAPEPAEDARGSRDFFVASPLDVGLELVLPPEPLPDDLREANRVLDEACWHPILVTRGYPRQFVDSPDPEGDLAVWAEENGHPADAARSALRILHRQLPELGGLRQGKVRLDDVLHRVIDEVLHAGIDAGTLGGRELLRSILHEARVEERFLGAKRRPIAGLLPPRTSVAWKTPYGDELPSYVHMEKCLGPECALCVTHCPEGGGGEVSAIRLVSEAPREAVPLLVRGFEAYLLRLDGTHRTASDLEDLTVRQPFTFEVNPDYCKSCGICIACCPHDVIEATTRSFDMRRAGT